MPKKPSRKAAAPKAPAAEREPACTFCLTPQFQVDILIQVDGADSAPAICDLCVGVAVLLIDQRHKERGNLGGVQ